MTRNNSRAVRAKPLQCVAICRALLLVINAKSQSEKSMEHVGWSGALSKVVVETRSNLFKFDFFGTQLGLQ